MDEEFFSIKKMLHKKYQRALRGRYILTVTRQKLYLSGSHLGNIFFNNRLVRRMAKSYFKFRFLLYGNY